jgi:hypothetical protein
MAKLNNRLDINSLISTRNFLAEIIQNARNDYEKAGTIQAFEVCYELANIITPSPRSSYYSQRNIPFGCSRGFNS